MDARRLPPARSIAPGGAPMLERRGEVAGAPQVGVPFGRQAA